VRDAANGRRRPNFKVAPEKQSFDVITGSFDTMFDDEIHLHRFILDPVTARQSRTNAAATERTTEVQVRGRLGKTESRGGLTAGNAPHSP
jgi:hypothetical protein